MESVDGMEVLLIRAGAVQNGPLNTVEVYIPLDALPRSEKIRADGVVVGLAQILGLEEERSYGRLLRSAPGRESLARSLTPGNIDTVLLSFAELMSLPDRRRIGRHRRGGTAPGHFRGSEGRGSTLLRDCPDSMLALAVDDALRDGRSGMVVAHGLDELGILLGIGLAALLGAANVVERDVQVA